MFRKKVKVRMHSAFFMGKDKSRYFFINVVNLHRDRSITITHVWLKDNGYSDNMGIINEARPLPVTLAPSETWETWVKEKDIAWHSIYPLHMGRVKISTGKVYKSSPNKNVPLMGTVPGAKKD